MPKPNKMTIKLLCEEHTVDLLVSISRLDCWKIMRNSSACSLNCDISYAGCQLWCTV